MLFVPLNFFDFLFDLSIQVQLYKHLSGRWSPAENRKEQKMTKSDLFKAAHKIARETKAIAGSYRIAFACALKDLYAGVITMKQKSAEQLAFEHFAELNSVYTSKDGTARVYIRATELLNDCSKAEARCSIIIARFADGSVEAAFDRGSNAGQRARIARALAAFAA
jgi:hypothetical protein